MWGCDLALSAVALAASVWLWRSRTRGANTNGLPSPPGPPRTWLLGNLFDMPQLQPWLKYMDWAERYGPIVRLQALGSNVVLLNTLEACLDLLEKRGAIYANRPRFVLGGELMQMDQFLTMRDGDHEWRHMRKFTHSGFSPAVVHRYAQTQELRALEFLRNVYRDPKGFSEQARVTAGKIIFSVSYGLPVETHFAKDADVVLDYFTTVTLPCASIVDLIPPLKHLPSWTPLVTFHRLAADCRRHLTRVLHQPFFEVKKEMEAGTCLPSFAREILSSISELPDQRHKEDRENTLKHAAATMYLAGLETIHQTLVGFIAAMTMYPEVQRRAQDEIDSVVGRDRLPTFEDRACLPYVNAVIKETLRWGMSVPCGFPHVLAQDDEYHGFHIPMGTMVLPNVYRISRVLAGPRGKPDEFIPERFLGDEKATDPATYIFGFGRRICPGRYVADGSVFAIVSGMLASFTIAPPPGKDGRPVSYKTTWTGSLLRYPERFESTFSARTPEANQWLSEACQL